ncbi:MAG TPA: hypothetical protein VN886_05525 [Acidimicrobiales bacterium]|nr:hypothetical protein [Acidimicrobiales bacterium]
MEGIGTSHGAPRSPRHYCIGVTRDGQRCKRNVREGQLYCSVHAEQDPIASVDLSRQTGKQLSRQTGKSFPTNGNPLSSGSRYEGLGMGDSSSKGSFSDSVTEAVEEFVNVDSKTGEILSGADVELPTLPLRSMKTIGAIRRERERAQQVATV